MVLLAQGSVESKMVDSATEMLRRDEWSKLLNDLKDAEMWKWSVAVGLLLGAWVLGMLVSAMLRRKSRQLQQVSKFFPLKPAYPVVGIILDAISAPLTMFLMILALWTISFTVMSNTVLGDWQIYNLPRAWRSILLTLMVTSVGWFVYRLVAVVDHLIARRLTQSDKLMGGSYVVPLIRKTLKTLIVIGIVIFIAQNILFWNVSAMLTALGLGGLAFALAAQQTLSNLLGSIVIYADRPFQANDTVKFRAYTGVVQDVGFRSTRIRSVDGTIVTIPNSAIANEPVETLGLCPGLRMDFNVTVKNNPVAPRTSVDHAAAATTAIQAVLDEYKDKLLAQPAPRVALSAVTAGVLTVSVQYWFATWDARELALFQQDVLLAILRHLTAAGLDLA